MRLFPAIDLKDGQCVRLLKGEMDSATAFANTPQDQAALFESQGFQWLHIVDLNGAFEGKSVNGSSTDGTFSLSVMPHELFGTIGA